MTGEPKTNGSDTNANRSDLPAKDVLFTFSPDDPTRIIGRGHTAGDFLEAYDWTVVEESPGRLLIESHLPAHVKNPRGQLFGGFTPTYVDLVSLFTVRAGPDRLSRSGDWAWLATTNMRIDYFEPVMGPTFQMESWIEKDRGRTVMIATRFLQDGELAVFALATMRKVASNPPGSTS